MPTVKTNVFLYTDIDIFKARHQLFFVFEMKKERKDKKGLWEALEISLGGHDRLWAHQNWAWEPKAGSKQL